jgi:hypothetical protein
LRVTVSRRTLQSEAVELKVRARSDSELVRFGDAATRIAGELRRLSESQGVQGRPVKELNAVR